MIDRNALLSFRLALVLLLIAAPQLLHAQGTSNNNSTAASIIVMGAVRAPGVFTFTKGMRLADAIALAGNANEHAGKTVSVKIVSRSVVNGTETEIVDYQLADLHGDDARLNPYLEPGEMVIVSSDMTPKVCIYGNVAKPQTIYLQQYSSEQPLTLTVTQAIDRAGGMLPKSWLEKSYIIRRMPDGTMRAVFINLKLIAKGRAEDVVLQPFDMVVVPSKKRAVGEDFGLKRLFSDCLSQ